MTQSFEVIILRCLLVIISFYHGVDASERLFAADFRAPSSPSSVIAEYQASFVQHKWDATGISHIVSGSIYAALSLGKLRMDLTYGGQIVSSLFDYARQNPDTTVPNYIFTLSPNTATQGTCAFYNVTPAYPLFPPDILSTNQATFVGLIPDNLFYADRPPLSTWSILMGQTSVTAYVDNNNTLVRIDFSSPSRSTYTTTRLFNILPGRPNENLFVNPCPSGVTTPTPTTSGASRNI